MEGTSACRLQGQKSKISIHLTVQENVYDGACTNSNGLAGGCSWSDLIGLHLVGIDQSQVALFIHDNRLRLTTNW